MPYLDLVLGPPDTFDNRSTDQTTHKEAERMSGPAPSSITAQVYGLVRDEDHAGAIALLEAFLEDFPDSRALLSLLAYCSYNSKDYARAAEFYESLAETCPHVEEYKLYYAQSLALCGSLSDAERVSSDNETLTVHREQNCLVAAYAQLESGNLRACGETLRSLDEDDPIAVLFAATLAFREGNFSKALQTFKVASKLLGSADSLSYCIALCHYRLKQYDAALKIVEKLTEEQHDESKDNDDDGSRYVVEALNLKAAICHQARRFDEARAAMEHVCLIKNGEDLDAVTIHNDAVINIEQDPRVGIEKLEYLLSNQPFPPETLGNLLTFYLSHDQQNEAAEMFTRNKQLANDVLTSDAYQYFDASLLAVHSPAEAAAALDSLLAGITPKLRQGQKAKDIAKAHSSRPATSATLRRPATARPTTAAERSANSSLANASREYDSVLDSFVPALMLRAMIEWKKKDFYRASQILKGSESVCRNNNSWYLNSGHVIFALGGNAALNESIRHYEYLVEQHARNLLEVSPVALANLCVAYVLTDRNDAAEAIIRRVEEEEQEDEGTAAFATRHSCIINLVVGTLYAVKGNFEFGADRVCKSLEPFDVNLNEETWFHAKRCFLALASAIARCTYFESDALMKDLIGFFRRVESHAIASDAIGLAPTGSSVEREDDDQIAREAEELRILFLALHE